jgi:hypothetical protein
MSEFFETFSSTNQDHKIGDIILSGYIGKYWPCCSAEWSIFKTRIGYCLVSPPFKPFVVNGNEDALESVKKQLYTNVKEYCLKEITEMFSEQL